MNQRRGSRRAALVAATVLSVTTVLILGQGTGVSQTAGEGVWETAGSLSVPRYDHTATLLADGTVLAAGGRTVAPRPNASLASAEIFLTKDNVWVPAGSLNDARWRHTATLLPDGRVLVAGGFTAPTTTANAQPVLGSAELYDPATDTWTRTGSMHTRRALHVAQLLADGRVLVAGGRTCDQPPPTACNFTFRTDTAEIYDPATGTWTPAGRMKEARHTSAAVRLADGTVVVPAGFTEKGNGDTADIYDPATGRWSESRRLNVPRARQGAMVLADGSVLVAAGFQGGDTSEVYDPARRTWSFSGTMSLPTRFNFSYVVMPNGKALVAGGATFPPASRPTSAEVYDPATGSWSSAGAMSSEHGSSSSLANSDQAVVLSSNPWSLAYAPNVCGGNCGKVLVVGNSPTGATELYTPTCPAVVPDPPQQQKCVD